MIPIYKGKVQREYHTNSLQVYYHHTDETWRKGLNKYREING